MMAKIEWYQEVLALEPGSKVFFPYARSLAEAGRREEALGVLHHGLSLHPEFLEARVFLVALLHEAGEIDGCVAELARVEKLFASYPGFWDAWSQQARQSGNSALALGTGFCAAVFRNTSLSLDELVLRSLHGEAAEPLAPLPLLTGPAATEAAAAVLPGPALSVMPETLPDRVESDQTVPAQVEFVQAAPVQAAPVQAAPVQAIELPAPVLDDDDGDEALSLRTRSMADVLAEQGDLQEAVAIYRELAAHERDPNERKSLNRRLKQLEKLLSTAESAPAQKAARNEPVAEQADAEEAVAVNEALHPDALTATPEASAPSESPVLSAPAAPVVSAPPTSAEARPDDVPVVSPAAGAETGKSGGAQGLRSVLENLAERLEARARA